MKFRMAYADHGLDVDVPDWVDAVSYGLRTSTGQVTMADFVGIFDRAGGSRWLAADSPLLIVNVPP